MSILSQSQNCYQEAISLNNEAVHQFEKGEYEEARLLFRDALRALRDSTIDRDRIHHTGDLDGKGSKVEFKWSKYAPFYYKLKLPTPFPETPYIFRKALLIERTTTGKKLSTKSKQNKLDEESKAIIYNLALSYLYSGFVNKNSILKKKAHQLFAKIINSPPDFPPKQHAVSKKTYGSKLADISIDNMEWSNSSIDTEWSNSEMISDRSNMDRYPQNASYDDIFSGLGSGQMESFESHELILTLS